MSWEWQWEPFLPLAHHSARMRIMFGYLEWPFQGFLQTNPHRGLSCGICRKWSLQELSWSWWGFSACSVSSVSSETPTPDKFYLCLSDNPADATRYQSAWLTPRLDYYLAQRHSRVFWSEIRNCNFLMRVGCPSVSIRTGWALRCYKWVSDAGDSGPSYAEALKSVCAGSRPTPARPSRRAEGSLIIA